MEVLSEQISIISSFVLFYTMNCSPVGDGLVNSALDGKSLISMGNALNKPVLSLLGLTFQQQQRKMNNTIHQELEKAKKTIKDEVHGIEKIEAIKSELSEDFTVLKIELCKLKSCSEWTEWSKCSAEQVNTFGVTSRSRSCGMNSQFCFSNSEHKLETEDTICQGGSQENASKGPPFSLYCPSPYVPTPNRFCIRVVNDGDKQSWDDAQNACNKDGGHLINIDSELKILDINQLLGPMALPDYTYFWIDGQKSTQNTEWKYKYGFENIGLSAWYPGEPDSSDSRLIYSLVNGVWYLYGVTFVGDGYYICEIV